MWRASWARFVSAALMMLLCLFTVMLTGRQPSESAIHSTPGLKRVKIDEASELELKHCELQLANICNPAFHLGLDDSTRVRDPAVHVQGNVHELYFTQYTGNPRKMWSNTSGYTVSMTRTSDWRTFSQPEAITPPGFCSPDAPVHWQGSTLLARLAGDKVVISGRGPR